MKKLNFLSGAVVIISALIFSGCVSVPDSPTPRFYMLSSIGSEQALEKIDIAPGVIVAVGPVGIPGYLDRPQIVTKNKNGTLNFAQFDRWTESLDSAIARVINRNLASLIPEASFQVFPCSLAIPLDYQLVIDVVQLDSQLDEGLVLTVQWSIIEPRSRRMLFTKRSQLSESINPQDYFGLTKALSAACVSLSREIAGDLANISKQPRPVKKDATK